MEHLTYLLTRIQISLEESKIKGFLLKPKQDKALDFLLIGKDVISVLPTGYGKSLIYQLLPYLYHLKKKMNIVVVVSPLNSIIED